jgi:peptidoglycan/xylan/chitin deacetylase (PgdA/CDA1 family)
MKHSTDHLDPRGRRAFLRSALAAGIATSATILKSPVAYSAPLDKRANTAPSSQSGPRRFWPNSARLVISISMQFESGVKPTPPDGPFPPATLDFPDTATASWYDYGIKEGIPRLLDLWDRSGIKVTSHMVGDAVDRAPALAKEIVARGHEAAAHGQSFVPTYTLSADQERTAYAMNIRSIETATGTRPTGMNVFGMRHTPATLGILQELGFLYHVDDVSADDPFTTNVNGKPFVVVPYTLRNNDFVRFSNPAMIGPQFVQELKNEFDALYEESAHRRRMMSIAVHDRVSGAPALSYALRDFLHYAQAKPSVSFMRKDSIAHWIISEQT